VQKYNVQYTDKCRNKSNSVCGAIAICTEYMNILKPYEENGQNSPIMYNMSSNNVSTVKVVIVICTEAVKQC